MRDDGTYSDAESEQIMDSALVPAPLGNYDAQMDPYNNALVYFFALFGLIFVVFAVVAVVIASYRIHKGRSHAVRGLVVALVALAIGTGTAIAAAASL